jgi:hypothetical protein
MKHRKWLATAAALAALAAPAGALAKGDDDGPGDDNGGSSGGGGDIRRAGECTGSTSSKIKVKTDDGGLEVEFEVDQNKSGVAWRVRIKDNSDVVFRGTRTTKGRSGSFSVEENIPNQSGTDRITGTAVNKQTGERCSASVSI